MELKPMEINPEVLSELDDGTGWQFIDILGLEDQSSSSEPAPSCAVMLLTQQHESHREQPAPEQSGNCEEEPEVYFLKRTAAASCETDVLLHTAANKKRRAEFDSGSVTKRCLDSTANHSGDDRVKQLKRDEVEADKENIHFSTFVSVDGQLYELGCNLLSMYSLTS
ncbi:ubiquitin carboxyl-terminal hydrolase isozyme L1-like [Megalops cyprinoides]|uniref:ubiquitin carboxyl-terminal hydrolase isozyme L1-like n=1 Tax=Megalops cyprinoides TaxID=118141 RepID=UPI0018646FBA|nr:ubiquitin carboxyl-terminal hydrolase isozyme L1-like [Megalops cyprinoides]